ncbi:glycosyl amidation-associated protein WbuZ [Chitinimonas arctica]|uniref:imidazole glycerol-phosphate synthase n=1 Tax=Chitinimonas arctica TaxID=2594795 RepID=A0A516SC57_9NEIS|nr:AglZ/HisF2 family acetamidino modification protein [Chitinimonas arctica]QDQ25724.1 glycosyl amidation-associated protein WbuZ [Chitinimonas arctica]
MLRIRVIPCLLLKGRGLVKTTRFKDPQYIGDPINAIKIFNDKEVDELVLLDVLASVEGKGPNFEVIEEIANECFMPVAYGGGITNLEQIRKILKLGIEKVVLNEAAFQHPELISAAAAEFGSQSIVVSMDVKRKLFGKYEVYRARGTKSTGLDPVAFALTVSKLGAGEIFLTAIDRDGTMEGYDLELIKQIARAVPIPVIASGGAGKIGDFREATHCGGASAVAAGAMFVFHGKHRGVLITYPEADALKQAFL